MPKASLHYYSVAVSLVTNRSAILPFYHNVSILFDLIFEIDLQLGVKSAQILPLALVLVFCGWKSTILTLYKRLGHLLAVVKIGFDPLCMNNDCIFIRHLTSIKPGISELMCHPGYAEEVVYAISTWTTERERELSVLTKPEVTAAIKRHRINLTHYGELRQWL